MFGIGTYAAFYDGFHSQFLKAGDRVEGGAQIAMVRPDGSGYTQVTSGASNNGFPSMAPDGKRFVYRTFGPDGEGLRILNLETKAVTRVTEGYDNFPLWSPRGDLIMFSRQADGDYAIYTDAPQPYGELFVMKYDGTAVEQITDNQWEDGTPAWVPQPKPRSTTQR